MAVTITTNTLSARVRYLNVSGSTANADAKDVVLAMANALIALGWSRYDTAGATAVVGTDDNAGVILRRAMSDNAQSDHYNYLGLRLVGSSTSTYTFYLIQAADWSSTTSMSAFVSGATASVYTPNSTGRTDFLNFAQGGTIWLFDGGKTLVITSQSGDTQIKGINSTWVVGEYKKEFGENVNAATGYIHNGVFTNSKWLLGGNGQGGSTSGHVMLTGVGVSSNPGGGVYNYGYFYASETASFASGNYIPNRTFYWADGFYYSQFVLTEAPAVSAAASALSRNASAPAACGVSFTTRVLMGYLGYIGQVTPTYSNSINRVLTGDVNGTTGITEFSQNVQGGVAQPFSASPGISTGFQNNYTLLNAIQEYSPGTLPTALQFNIFEPTLSCGTTNGLATSWSPPSGSGTYSGPQYKFSMLGRIFDMKIFGPYSSEKYVFLDSMTIPCDADGFYNAQGTNKDFWLIPSGNHMAFVMPK